MTKRLLLCAALAATFPAAHARADDGAGGRPPHHAPPPEAFAACQGLEADGACTVAAPDGQQLAGTCRSGPQGGALACAPARPPRG